MAPQSDESGTRLRDLISTRRCGHPSDSVPLVRPIPLHRPLRGARRLRRRRYAHFIDATASPSSGSSPPLFIIVGGSAASAEQQGVRRRPHAPGLIDLHHGPRSRRQRGSVGPTEPARKLLEPRVSVPRSHRPPRRWAAPRSPNPRHPLVRQTRLIKSIAGDAPPRKLDRSAPRNRADPAPSPPTSSSARSTTPETSARSIVRHARSSRGWLRRHRLGGCALLQPGG